MPKERPGWSRTWLACTGPEFGRGLFPVRHVAMLDGVHPFAWPTIAGKRLPRRDILCDASLAHAAAVAHCHSYRVLRLGALEAKSGTNVGPD